MKRVFGILFLLVLSGVFASATIMHDTSEFWINVDGNDMTLQDAITDYELSIDYTYLDVSDLSYIHRVSEIWIETGVGYKTLLGALQTKDFTTATASSLANNPFYHEASEIDILLSGETIPTDLQTAIDNNDIGCVASFGAPCDYSSCVNGITSCEGICIQTTNKPTNTPCGGTSICDGAGTCTDCVDNSYSACYDRDRYWYSSCDDRGVIREDCGGTTSVVIAEQCSSGSGCSGTCWWEKRLVTERGCNADECYSTSYENWYIAGSCPSSGGKIICTELYETGLMDEETYQLDLEYSKTHFSNEALKGYRSWGIPVVKEMRNHPDAMAVIVPMVDAFMDEIKYRSGKSESSNEMGAYYLNNAVPLFERIGKHIDNPNWESLFDKDSWAVRQIKLIRRIFEKENPNNKMVEDYFSAEKVAEMFYVALGDKTEPDMEFTIAFIDELESAVEEIEELVGNQ